MAHIRVERITVSFPVYSASARSLKRGMIGLATGGRIGLDGDRTVQITALDDVDLTFEHGDRVGLIGHNGAGKSTLLKVLAGIYEPVRGRVRCEGRVASMSNPRLGIDQDSTGYENIFQRGLFMGLRPREIEARTDEIAAFTELGDYLAMPVRTYSAGMAARLAFAISTCVEADILLMDEWLSAGDAAFVARARERMSDLVDKAGILVLASHSDNLIRETCNKALLLERGKVVGFGPIDDILAIYHGRRQAAQPAAVS